MEPIQREEAIRLCTEIRAVKARRLFTQCWGCVRFSRGDPAKMCFANAPATGGVAS